MQVLVRKYIKVRDGWADDDGSVGFVGLGVGDGGWLIWTGDWGRDC